MKCIWLPHPDVCRQCQSCCRRVPVPWVSYLHLMWVRLWCYMYYHMFIYNRSVASREEQGEGQNKHIVTEKQILVLISYALYNSYPKHISTIKHSGLVFLILYLGGPQGPLFSLHINRVIFLWRYLAHPLLGAFCTTVIQIVNVSFKVCFSRQLV